MSELEACKKALKDLLVYLDLVATCPNCPSCSKLAKDFKDTTSDFLSGCILDEKKTG